jgi:fibronectin type 3 domain-containing protein
MGDGALLTFTLPGKSITNQRLAQTPTCDIFRGALKSDGAPDQKSWRMVYTIPGALVAGYETEKHVEFLDPISPEETKAHPGGKVAYQVRTRVSAKKSSLGSNIVSLAVHPVPERIPSVQVEVTESALELTWPAPTQTSGGDALGDFTYRLYRGQLDSSLGASAIDAATKDLVHAKWKSKLALLASPAGDSYRDADFEFDKTYVYVVRTAVPASGGIVESADSVPVVVTPKDTFPPSAPAGLVGAVIAENPTAPAVVDLSWSISPESDVVGYRVYRSEQQGARGEAIPPALVPTPALRDAAVQPGHRYWYSVTALDRAGNESAAGAPAMVEVP